MTHTRKTLRWLSVFAAAAVLSLAPMQNAGRVLAGPSEDALKECLEYCAIGGLVWAAGCAAGYTIFGATGGNSTPKFHFAARPGLPWSPLGQDVLYYEHNEPAVLSVGLWKGCEPQCAAPVALVRDRGGVERVTFSAVPLDRFVAAGYPDEEPWVSLGTGTYNNRTYTWDLRVNPATFQAKDTYLLRAEFIDSGGKTQLGFGLAFDASTLRFQ